MFQPIFETTRRPFCFHTKLVPGGSSLRNNWFGFKTRENVIVTLLVFVSLLSFICLCIHLQSLLSQLFNSIGVVCVAKLLPLLHFKLKRYCGCIFCRATYSFLFGVHFKCAALEWAGRCGGWGCHSFFLWTWELRGHHKSARFIASLRAVQIILGIFSETQFCRT